MSELYDKATGKFLATISDDDLNFLIDSLEEESATDEDYYIARPTLELLKEQGMSPALAAIIEEAMGSSDDVEIVFKRT
jgi:hypothetical protein